jgi:hypothetical protein
MVYKNMADTKNIMNIVYHSAVLSGLAVAYTMLGRSLIKIRPADLGKLDFEDGAKLVTVITASIATKDFIVKQGIIPENISV